VANWKVKPIMDITKSHDSPTGPQLGFLLRWDCYLATFLQLDQFQFAPKKEKKKKEKCPHWGHFAHETKSL
jgi:hypothetical protein